MATMAKKNPEPEFPQLSTDPRCKPLWDWLCAHHATCCWTQKVVLPKSTWQPAKQIATIECWRVGAGVVLVRIDEHGWGIFTELNSNEVSATLADVERRIMPPAPEPWIAEARALLAKPASAETFDVLNLRGCLGLALAALGHKDGTP